MKINKLFSNKVFFIHFGVPFCLMSLIGVVTIITIKQPKGVIIAGIYIFLGVLLGFMFYFIKKKE